MAGQQDGPNSLDYPLGSGAFTGHTRGSAGGPLTFGPGTYRNVFDSEVWPGGGGGASGGGSGGGGGGGVDG